MKRHGSSLESAMGEFSKVFASKSGNHWPLTAPFEKKKGKYMLIGAFNGEICTSGIL